MIEAPVWNPTWPEAGVLTQAKISPVRPRAAAASAPELDMRCRKRYGRGLQGCHWEV